MKKFFLLVIFLISTSCINLGRMGCLSETSNYDRNTAQSYYESFGVAMVNNQTFYRVRKLFNCEYRGGDLIYSYKTLWGTKYILVRRGLAVTYAEE